MIEKMVIKETELRNSHKKIQIVIKYEGFNI